MDADDFPTTLRAAIADSGLSLEAVRARLLDLGVRVSVASLSYWQSGRSRPERAASLAALGPLEEVLGVPRGHLVSRVRFVRGGMLPSVPSTSAEEMRAAWPDVDQAMIALGFAGAEGVRRRSLHDRLVIGPHGEQVSHRIRTIITAVAERVDRFAVWSERDGVDVSPTVRGLRHCRVGHTFPVPGRGAVGAEMLLDRPLHEGQSVVVEHEFVTSAREERTSYARLIAEEVREVVVEVTFDPARPPVSAEYYSIVDGRESVAAAAPASPLVAVVLCAPPGHHGVRWSW